MSEAPNPPTLPDPAPPGSNMVCTCSPTGGTCQVCRRRHRVAYGLVGIVAAVTLAAWVLVYFFVPRT